MGVKNILMEHIDGNNSEEHKKIGDTRQKGTLLKD